MVEVTMDLITKHVGPKFTLAPALCLDLDGTVRYSKGGTFISGPDDVVLFPDVEAKLWEYRDAGFLICGISNQGGVSFGHKTPQQCEAEIDATMALFQRNPFHIIKCCYHMAGGKHWPYNYRSLLRKPDIGMLVLCEVDAWESQYVIDWEHSILVGDRDEDRQCAEQAGIPFVDAAVFFERERG